MKENLRQIYQSRLRTVHPDLARLVTEIQKFIDVAVICGFRGKEDQEKALREGKTKLNFPNSKHNLLPALAIDMMPWNDDEPNIRWDDNRGINEFSSLVFACASRIGVRVSWGGFWKELDYCHWELNN